MIASNYSLAFASAGTGFAGFLAWGKESIEVQPETARESRGLVWHSSIPSSLRRWYQVFNHAATHLSHREKLPQAVQYEAGPEPNAPIVCSYLALAGISEHSNGTGPRTRFERFKDSLERRPWNRK